MKKIFSFAVLFFLVLSILSHAYKNFSSRSDSSVRSHFQTAKKPKQDYMKTLLSRNTKPLGLKENKALTKLLNQPYIKWVIRSEIKHVLN